MNSTQPTQQQAAAVTLTSARLVQARDGTWVSVDHLCPDLLRLEQIGAADGLRGRVVRGFFWLLRAWPPGPHGPPGRPPVG